jgi:hypothetical protein
MTDHYSSPEHQAFRDRIAEHVAAIHAASREYLQSRRTTNDAGPGKLLVAMETGARGAAADPGDPDIDGRVRIENVCPAGTVPIFVTYECGSDDPFACHDVYCM